MSTSESKLIETLQETVNIQTALLGIVFGLLIRRGTITREQVSEELETVIALAPPGEAEQLAFFQSRLIPRSN